MTDVRNVAVGPGEAGERLDRFLAGRLPGITRSAVQRLIEKGLVTLAGKTVAANHKTKEGEAYRIAVPPPVPSIAIAEDIPLDVVHEDAHIAIINKPAGMVVHPAKGHAGGTLVNALLAHCPDLTGIGGELRPGIVHRLDKDTTGLIAVAKNDAAHAALSGQLKTREMGREYLAVVKGEMRPLSGAIEKPVGRHPVYRKKMSTHTRMGRAALTLYETLETYPGVSLLKVGLKTGRTHQIRVHLAAVGHPILGDALYGKGKTALIARPALHAWRLTLVHPVSGETMTFTAPPPEDFQRLLAALKKQ